MRNTDIQTVTNLASAPTEDLTKLGISRKKTAEFITKAKLMAKGDLSGVEKVDEQAAEILVTVAKIDSKKNLAASARRSL